MYVRMVWGRLRRGRWDEYERHYNENILGSAIEQVEGFLGRQLLRSSENLDEGISISMWDSLDSMRDYETSLDRQGSVKATEHLYTGDYWVKKFEVRASTLHN